MASHTPFQSQSTPKIGSDRSFGLVFAAAFLIIAILPLLRSAPVRWWALVATAAFALAALVAPSVLRPLNQIWFAFGIALHHVVNPIVMGAMFLLAVIPTALVLRAFGRDALRLERDRASATYWVTRDRPAPAPCSMGRQF